MEILSSLLIILFIYLVLKLIGIKTRKYFSDKNVKSLKPNLWFGNTRSIVFRTKSKCDFLQEMYSEFPGQKLFGFYDNHRPGYFLKDPELIKQLTIKHFNCFEDHRNIVPGDLDPILGKTLVALKGEKWREMRSIISPSFTGIKMKLMFDLLLKSTNDLVTEYSNQNPTDHVIEIKHFFTHFTNDIIATCAFGVEINSIKNPENEFFKMAKVLLNFGTITHGIKFAAFFFTPWLMKLFKVSFLSKTEQDYFSIVILKAIQNRIEKNISRPDLIDLLTKQGRLTNVIEPENTIQFSAVEELSNGKTHNKFKWTDEELIAQCLIFFIAGFDTVSTALTYMAYEAAVNPDIQLKLINEIDQVNQQLEGNPIDYTTISKMKYLNQFVSEILRKWSPTPFIDRLCNKSFRMRYDNQDLIFKKSVFLWIPIYAIHHDPIYYPDPEKFDPERFNDERKHEINRSAYIPFGTGPRSCIGSRFALMELKTIFYTLLLKFTLDVCDKTEIPAKPATYKGTMTPNNGMWLNLKPRKIN